MKTICGVVREHFVQKTNFTAEYTEFKHPEHFAGFLHDND